MKIKFKQFVWSGLSYFGDVPAKFVVVSHLTTMMYCLCSSLVVLILTPRQPHLGYYVIKPTL